MKKIILSTLLALSFSQPSLAAAKDPAAKAKEALTKLTALRVSELKTVDENTTLEEAEMKAQDDVFDMLEEASKAATKAANNVELQNEIIRVAVIMLKKDPTQFAGEMILPFYEGNREGFDAAVGALPAADAKLVREAVKNAAREKKRGNG